MMNINENEGDVLTLYSINGELINCNIMEYRKNGDTIKTKKVVHGYEEMPTQNGKISRLSDADDCKFGKKCNEEILYRSRKQRKSQEESLYISTQNKINSQTVNVNFKSGSFDTVINSVRSLVIKYSCDVASNIFGVLKGLFVFYFRTHARKIFTPITLKNLVLPVLKDTLVEGNFFDLSIRMVKCRSNIFLKKQNDTNSIAIRFKCVSMSACKFFSSFKDLGVQYLHSNCKYKLNCAIKNIQLQKITNVAPQNPVNCPRRRIKTIKSGSTVSNKNCKRSERFKNNDTCKKRSAPDFDNYTSTSDVKKIKLEPETATKTLHVIDDAFDSSEYRDINDPKFVKVNNIYDAFIAVKNQWGLQYESNPHLDLTVRRSTRSNLISHVKCSPVSFDNFKCPIAMFDDKIRNIDAKLQQLNRNMCTLYHSYNVSIKSYYVLCEINRQIDQCKRDEERLKNEYASLCDARDEVQNLYKFYFNFSSEYNISQYQNTENGNKRKHIDVYDAFYGANAQ